MLRYQLVKLTYKGKTTLAIRKDDAHDTPSFYFAEDTEILPLFIDKDWIVEEIAPVSSKYTFEVNKLLSLPILGDMQRFSVIRNKKTRDLLLELKEKREMIKNQLVVDELLFLKHNESKTIYNIILKVIQVEDYTYRVRVLNTKLKDKEFTIRYEEDRPIRKFTDDDKVHYL